MQKTKIVIALVVLAAIALVAVSIASAQIAATPNPTTPTTPNNSFLGWIGRCFGFGGAPYYGTQAPASGSQPLNITVTDPNTNTTTSFQTYPGYGMPYYNNQPQNPPATNPNTGAPTPYQRYYGNGFRGGCMGRFW